MPGNGLLQGRKTLVVYLMAGRETPALAEAAVEGGADVVEIGFPFSDPLADGPVVHAAGTVALRAGATTHEVLAVGRALSERVPVVTFFWDDPAPGCIDPGDVPPAAPPRGDLGVQRGHRLEETHRREANTVAAACKAVPDRRRRVDLAVAPRKMPAALPDARDLEARRDRHALDGSSAALARAAWRIRWSRSARFVARRAASA